MIVTNDLNIFFSIWLYVLLKKKIVRYRFISIWLRYYYCFFIYISAHAVTREFVSRGESCARSSSARESQCEEHGGSFNDLKLIISHEQGPSHQITSPAAAERIRRCSTESWIHQPHDDDDDDDGRKGEELLTEKVKLFTHLVFFCHHLTLIKNQLPWFGRVDKMFHGIICSIYLFSLKYLVFFGVPCWS